MRNSNETFLFIILNFNLQMASLNHWYWFYESLEHRIYLFHTQFQGCSCKRNKSRENRKVNYNSVENLTMCASTRKQIIFKVRTIATDRICKWNKKNRFKFVDKNEVKNNSLHYRLDLQKSHWLWNFNHRSFFLFFVNNFFKLIIINNYNHDFSSRFFVVMFCHIQTHLA